MVATVNHAERYAFEIETWNGAAWRPYWTYESRENAKRFNPSIDDVVYRWRARARVDEVWRSWSHHARIDYGTPRAQPPEDAVDVPDPPEVADDPPPEVAEDPPAADPPEDEDPPGAPVALLPEAEAHIVSDSVTLECTPLPGATRYHFEVENFLEGRQTWVAYYTWSDPVPRRRFWPVSSARYRWRVRATTDGPGAPSSWRRFDFERR